MKQHVVRGILWLTVLLLVECSTNITASSSDLCSFRKSSEKCLCMYKKVTNSVFPILHADCTQLRLQQIPNMTDVQDLDVSHNSIQVLDPMKNAFESLKIRTLRMSFNRLEFIHQDYFRRTPNLLELDLSNNELVKFSNSLVFNTLAKLQVLNLDSNRISTLPERIFEGLQNLKELDVSYNYLGGLFDNTPCLFNSTLGINSHITSLKLDGNGIVNISSNFFDGASDLKYLSLANNPLKNIPNVPSTLTYMDISGSDITKILPQELNCPSLKVLKLNRLLKLETVENYAFYTLKILEELQLNECRKLKQLNVLAFDMPDTDCPIKRLSISKSGLRTISSKFADVFKTMEKVDIQNNPWSCDCNILWLQKSNMSQIQGDNLKCVTPGNLLNRNIMELTEKDIPDCMNTSNYYQIIVIAILCCFLGVLIALIAYLVYLGPLYYKNRYRNIGPQSPYNGNTLSYVPETDDLQ